jgi:ubiquinone/menaquinone biosynthesis C-methylase UbiE
MNLVQALHPILSYAPLYKCAMTLLGSERVHKLHTKEYIRPVKGDRVVDLGCGPGDMILSLPQVEYTGIDVESKYIEHARIKYGSKGSFIHKDLSELHLGEYSDVDIALSTGVLHHLTDDQARHLLRLAKSFLKPSGRLVTFDPCFLESEKQHPFDVWMLKNDRGKFVRKEPEYIAIAKEVFPYVKASVRSDLLRIPYTIIIMECSVSEFAAR